MGTKFDYLTWRGDLAFSTDGLNEVDGSILAMLSYIDYYSITRGRDISLKGAVRKYCPDRKYDSVKLGLIIPSKKINKLFCSAAQTLRYGDVRATDYVSRTSVEEICQFAAVTFHLTDKRAVISFRGTDDSLVGWREDCHLSFCEEIPAQRMALEYTERMIAKYPEKKFYLVGHSKGGNLAVYSAVKCSKETRARIIKAYSYDGPGLSYELAHSKEFRAAQKKLEMIVPQSSFIGIMFDVCEQYTVVNALSRGAFQHDSFTWDVRGGSFVHLPELSQRGKKNAEQFRESMARMSLEEKREFVDMLFSVIESTGAKTLTDFTDRRFKKAGMIIKNYSGMDKEKKALMQGLFFKLFEFKKE